MSLIVMFLTTMTQKAEEDLLNQVDDYSNEYFQKRLREDKPAGGDTPVEQMAYLQQQMMELYQGCGLQTFEQMFQLLAYYNQYVGGEEENLEVSHLHVPWQNLGKEIFQSRCFRS